MDFPNNSRNDILILSTGAQTQSSPDDTGKRFVCALLALSFAGCRDESLPGVPVIDARLADMRAVSGVSEAGAGVDAGHAADAAPGGVDAPGDAAGDASSPPPRRGPTPLPARRPRPRMALGSTLPTRRPPVPPLCAAAWCCGSRSTTAPATCARATTRAT